MNEFETSDKFRKTTDISELIIVITIVTNAYKILFLKVLNTVFKIL